MEVQRQHQSFQRTLRTDLLSDGLVGSPCSPRDSQESSPTPQFKSINSSVLRFLYSPTLTPIHNYLAPLGSLFFSLGHLCLPFLHCKYPAFIKLHGKSRYLLQAFALCTLPWSPIYKSGCAPSPTWASVCPVPSPPPLSLSLWDL